MWQGSAYPLSNPGVAHKYLSNSREIRWRWVCIQYMTQTQRRCIFHWCACVPTCTYKHLTSWKCAESKQRVLFLFKRLETSTLNTHFKKKSQSAKQSSCCYMEKHAMIKLKMCSRSSWRRKKKPWRLIFPHAKDTRKSRGAKAVMSCRVRVSTPCLYLPYNAPVSSYCYELKTHFFKLTMIVCFF